LRETKGKMDMGLFPQSQREDETWRVLEKRVMRIFGSYERSNRKIEKIT
jgi:hypothetical protein